MLQYVSDYAKELRRVGELQFSVQWNTPVLVLMGIAGQVKDNKGNAGASTLKTEYSVTEARRVNALVGRVFPLRAPRGHTGPLVLGRTTDAQITIPEYSISKAHCQFTMKGGRVYVADLDSTNRTYVDGTAIEPRTWVELQSGVELTIGRFAMMFRTALGFLELLKTQHG